MAESRRDMAAEDGEDETNAAHLHDREQAGARRDPDGWLRANLRWLLSPVPGGPGGG